jgi:hypothetical protein
LIYASLNIHRFENVLVISFVFSKSSGKFYTALPLPRKDPAHHYWACIHVSAAFGYADGNLEAVKLVLDAITPFLPANMDLLVQQPDFLHLFTN